MEPASPIPTLLTTPQAAGRISLSPKTLEKLRHVGGGPKFKKLAGAVRYAEEDLVAWVESCTRLSTSDRGRKIKKAVARV
jgi:hypothetical protein